MPHLPRQMHVGPAAPILPDARSEYLAIFLELSPEQRLAKTPADKQPPPQGQMASHRNCLTPHTLGFPENTWAV